MERINTILLRTAVFRESMIEEDTLDKIILINTESVSFFIHGLVIIWNKSNHSCYHLTHEANKLKNKQILKKIIAYLAFSHINQTTADLFENNSAKTCATSIKEWMNVYCFTAHRQLRSFSAHLNLIIHDPWVNKPVLG